MDFGITIKPDISIDRILSLTRQAESSGFSFGWIFDSHVIWKEPFPLLTLMAANTKKMRLGTCVTNPAVRDVTVSASLFATLNLASGGRMELGIGRGDSSRRVLGKKPTTLENLEEFVRIFRNLNAGKTVDLEGVPAKFPWTNGEVPRVWVAGYGPKALRTAGRIGDGVILQFADPDLIDWCLGFVREGAKEAGRDFTKIEVMAAAPVWASDDLKTAREHVVAPCADLFRKRPRQVRLSPPLRSRQRQRRFRHRRSRRPLLCDRPHRRASQEARQLAQSRRHPIQHLPDVRRRRKNPGRLPAQNSRALCKIAVAHPFRGEAFRSPTAHASVKELSNQPAS